ncbi:hypothetical protein FOB63_004225 [Clavispora lusitaniae]|uniref:uncharacterized protein n=1 Tax=Clavispora lusitaniae TaxID=36911 RepID=UPI00202BF97A|nr:hypothetical protein FOB63_004225 [Clavispora lusitaniae]
MVGFPQIPKIRGDTDDDASIHLHSHVGPAKPIRKRNYDQQIMAILNRKPQNASEDESESEEEILNDHFRKFTSEQKGHVFESEDEDTQVEEERESRLRQKQKQPSINRSTVVPAKKTAVISLYDPKVLGFLLGGLVILLLWPFQSQNRISPEPQDLTGVNARIGKAEERISALDDLSKALASQIDAAQAKQDAFINVYSHGLESVEKQLSLLQNSVSGSSEKLASIGKEVSAYKSKVDNMELVKENPEELQARLDDLSKRLSRLSQLHNDIEGFKQSIVDSLVQKLPEHVPVFFKDNKIHYLPEFQKFLYAFIEKHGSETFHLNWDQFLRENNSSMQKYIHEVLKSPGVKLLTREDFEKSLNDRLSQQSAAFNSKLNKLIDSVDLTSNFTSFETLKKANDVMLENLVESVTKRSIKVNYAKYGLGSRILGYLTSTGLDSYREKSIARMIFLGWYDYLTSNGLRSPQNLKYNANNILVDNGDYWRCEKQKCSVGVRLSTPIIVTDLVFKNPLVSKPSKLHLPTKVSIYIKPRRKQQVSDLKEYLIKFRPDFLAPPKNKYLAKFFKIQEVQLSGQSSSEYIKLPVSIVNLKILTRDLYLEIESNEGSTGLCNVKVYGIEEFYSLKYADEFETFFEKAQQQEKKHEEFPVYDSLRVLGDDDYVYS